VRAAPSVDILVNNLGIYRIKDFAAITDDDWRRYFEVNVLSGARLARAYFPGMLKRNWGRIFAKGRPTSLLQRMIEPDEIASLVAYVASPLSSATNGAALRVDGGVTPTIA
jgi:NAD(P)-dependent dehydrogenase (short-subunit alcohol dehydrogenase family)